MTATMTVPESITDLPDQRRLKILGKMAYGDVLDVGCHDVQNPYLRRAIGFDMKAPKVTRPNYRDFVCGNAEQLDEYFYPKSFDTIIAGEIAEHLENLAGFLRGAHVVLKDKGQLLITTPNPYHWTTLVGNMLFIRGGMEYEHINLITFRAFVAMADRTGWRVKEVRKASAGMRLWHNTRKWFIPCPTALAWQHLYVCVKK